MTLDSVDINKVTPMMRQYIEEKKRNRDIILFYRLGDFYEMFFEDALIVSRELELTLTGKSAGLDERIPMCGVPYHSASVYIDKLLKKDIKWEFVNSWKILKMLKESSKEEWFK